MEINPAVIATGEFTLQIADAEPCSRGNGNETPELDPIWFRELKRYTLKSELLDSFTSWCTYPTIHDDIAREQNLMYHYGYEYGISQMYYGNMQGYKMSIYGDNRIYKPIFMQIHGKPILFDPRQDTNWKGLWRVSWQSISPKPALNGMRMKLDAKNKKKPKGAVLEPVRPFVPTEEVVPEERLFTQEYLNQYLRNRTNDVIIPMDFRTIDPEPQPA